MEYNRAYTDYQLNRSFIRKFIRKLYLNHTVSFSEGKTIDFGCGVGELLRILPKGSKGYDVNKDTVDHCLRQGLNVTIYNPETDDYSLYDCKPGNYDTLILSHVLEHMENPVDMLRKLFKSCRRIGIGRVIIVVPCLKGYEFDKTHKIYIDLSYINENNLNEIEGYKLHLSKFFPFKFSWAVRHFVYNELLIVYDATA
jgi:SAM-dependent methyltransferase